MLFRSRRSLSPGRAPSTSARWSSTTGLTPRIRYSSNFASRFRLLIIHSQVTGGTLTFSDGSVVQVPSLNNDGTASYINISPARNTTTILFTVTSVSASTGNVGLSAFLRRPRRSRALLTRVHLQARSRFTRLQSAIFFLGSDQNEIRLTRHLSQCGGTPRRLLVRRGSRPQRNRHSLVRRTEPRSW